MAPMGCPRKVQDDPHVQDLVDKSDQTWWIDQEFGTIYIGMYGTNQKVEEWH